MDSREQGLLALTQSLKNILIRFADSSSALSHTAIIVTMIRYEICKAETTW